VSLQDEIKQLLDEMEARLNERIERMETRLLTEFHKWASPAEARMRTQRAYMHEFDMRVDQLADRIEKLENPQ
jgi:uncharacterized protein (DUF305 family)